MNPLEWCLGLGDTAQTAFHGLEISGGQVKDTFDCSWCKAAAESDPDIPYNFPVSEIGGYDKATGEPICENCRDGAVELV